ncbi:MAG: hypothetical protein JRK53_27225 [Deltaproteobacteria bacterium]|nr:hypothetical protein [Deltaproteobacteria bacterium]
MISKFRDIAARYHLADIYAFGSRADDAVAYARGEKPTSLYPDSDIDIGILIKSPARLTARQRAALVIEMEDFFGVRRVDVVFLSEADPFLALDIIRGCLLYCEDRESQAHYELYVLRRAGDLLPFKKQRMEMILERGAS